MTFRVLVTLNLSRRRRFLAVTPNRRAGTWSLQWANPGAHGHHYEPPIESGFTTKKLAIQRKRELLAGGAR